MRKLKLDPEDLRIETFTPEAGQHGHGTVRGYYSYPMGCFPPSDSEPPMESCGYHTCAGDTCWQTCNGYTCTCDCGGGSAQCESAGPTYCFRDYSCLQQCVPIPP